MGKFKDFCEDLFITYSKNIGKLTKDSTDKIFSILKKPNNDIYPVKDISIGKFYLLKYNYNGNKIWCPVFIVNDEYDTIKQKRIIYAINIDYMPYSYRILFFDILFDNFRKTIEYNNGVINKNQELPLKINIKYIYKLLKINGGYEYVITAYDFSKIDGYSSGKLKLYFISTNFVHRLIFINTKLVNLKNIKDLSLLMDNYNIKNKLDSLLEEFENIKNDLDEKDEKEYYKRLKKLEQKYKLIKNKK